MKTKIVTAYWLDVHGYPFQGSLPIRKPRYQGSLISHCRSNVDVVCYTHEKNIDELLDLKEKYKLNNLELKILELTDVKYHTDINNIRLKNFSTDLDGRGPEIMWGKFDVIERECEDNDFVYWVDVGLHHPGIFPWMYSKVYNPLTPETNFNIPVNWWAVLDVFDFSKFVDSSVYSNLNTLCKDKIVFTCCSNPQVGYPLFENKIVESAFNSPYPVGAMVGGNTNILKEYIKIFWKYVEKALNCSLLCTEEVLMKPSYDILSADKKISLLFDVFANDPHDTHHYSLWSEKDNNKKPFYMMWQDIKKNNT